MARLILLTPLILLFTASVKAALAICYYPDGTTQEAGHVPCNQTTSSASACCNPNDSCSTSGICLGGSGWQYRGSCTDSTWVSSNCARQFPDCITDPSSGEAYSGFTAIWSCSPIGTSENEFCCSYGNGSSSCCASRFSLGVTGFAFTPGYDAKVQSISAAAVSSYYASATGTRTTGTAVSATSGASSATASFSNSNEDLGTKIGVGVGVPLGVLALGILSFLFWREYGKHHAAIGGAAAVTPMAENGTTGGVDGNYPQNYQDYRQIPSNMGAQSLHTTRPSERPELAWNPPTPQYVHPPAPGAVEAPSNAILEMRAF